MTLEEFIAESRKGGFWLERHQVDAQEPLEPLEDVAVRLFLAMVDEQTIAVSHGMALHLLRSLAPASEAREVSRVINSSPVGITPLSVTGNIVSTELFLLDRAAVFLSLERPSYLQSSATIAVAILHLGERPSELDRFLGRLQANMLTLGLIRPEARLIRVKQDEDDTVWMDSLPNMKTPTPDPKRLLAARKVEAVEVRYALRKARTSTLRWQDISDGDALKRAALLQDWHVGRCTDGKDGFSTAVLDEIASSSIECGKCHKPAREHRIESSARPSPLASELITKSKWMAELATLSLMGSGVALRSIRVPDDSRSPDIIDLAFVYDGRRYIVELKDDNVTAGDAGNFISRLDDMASLRSFVITTKSVSSDARKVFDRMGGRGALFALPAPTYLEGSRCVSDLRAELLFQRLRDFSSSVLLTGPGKGISTYQLLLMHFFPNPRSSPQEETDIAGGVGPQPDPSAGAS
ncbi:MAG: hypothetical protein WEC75_12030 [Dehalococcoidia bacterium]